jgi:uncharacterized membrane protein YhhN
MSAGLWLVVAAMVVAAADWLAVARRSKPAEYVLKPLVMVLLLAAALELRHGDPNARCALVGAALLLSLVGDVFLMLPRDLFVAGLAAFLLAHVAYVGAFDSPRITGVGLGAIVVAVLAVVAVGAPIALRIRTALIRTGRASLAFAVQVYVVAISLMVIFALVTAFRPDWPADRSALAIAGALLFFGSDGMIGWSRFVRDFPGSRVLIVVTYHLGQAGLLLGLLGTK